MKKTASALLLAAIFNFTGTVVANKCGALFAGEITFTLGWWLALSGLFLLLFSSASFHRRNLPENIFRVSIISNALALESVVFLSAGLFWSKWQPVSDMLLSRGILVPGRYLFTVAGLLLSLLVFVLLIVRLIMIARFNKRNS